jgi:hypothetical protein
MQYFQLKLLKYLKYRLITNIFHMSVIISCEYLPIVADKHLSYMNCTDQWPRGLRCRSAAERLLGLWVQIPRGHGCLSLVQCLCVVR